MARIGEEGVLLGSSAQWAISSQLERSRLEHRPRVRGGVAPRPAGVPGAVVGGALGAAEGRGGVKKWREQVAWKLVA